jgi:hypothetical protein
MVLQPITLNCQQIIYKQRRRHRHLVLLCRGLQPSRQAAVTRAGADVGRVGGGGGVREVGKWRLRRGTVSIRQANGGIEG